MSQRLTLALPIDLARTFDHTVTQTQLANNTFQGTPDDRDTLSGLIEDAEDEFRQLADVDMRISRVGVAGQRETYEQLTYEVSGHSAFKRSFSRVGSNYRRTEVEKDLKHDRLLPFDPAEGDEAYFYRGLGGARGSGSSDGWEDVTGELGETWSIVDHSRGTVVFHPIELARAMASSGRGVGMPNGRLRELRLAISYRYGALGGSRGTATQTELAESITNSQTGSVSVADGSGFPVGAGSIIVLLGSEYVEVEPDPSNDSMTIVSRGVRGTETASHSSGDRVQYTPPSVRKAVACRAGMSLIQSGRYSAFLPDEDDAITKNDLLDRLEQTWKTTVDAMS